MLARPHHSPAFEGGVTCYLNPFWQTPLNPVCNPLPQAPDIQELSLRCMDQETMADAEFIGMAKVPLRQCKPGEVRFS